MDNLNIITKFNKTEKSLDKYKDQYPNGLIISGYANKAVIDSVGDIVLPSAYDLKRADIMPLLYNHDRDRVVGKILELNVKSDGLEIVAYVDDLAEEEYKLITKIKKELIQAFSIGFIIKDATWDEESDVFIIKDLELLEVSVVTVPCNSDSTIVDMKTIEKYKNQTDDKEEVMDMEKLLEAIKGLKEDLNKEPEVKKEMIDELTKKLDSIVSEKAKLAEEIAKMKESEEVKKLTDEISSMKTLVEDLKKELDEVKAAEPKVEVKEADPEVIEKNMPKYKDVYIASLMHKKDFKDTMAFSKLPERVKSVTLDNDFLTKISKEILGDVRTNTIVANLLEDFSDVSTTYEDIPYAGGASAAFGSLSLQNYSLTQKVSFSLVSLMAGVKWTYASEEESILPWLPKLREKLTEAMADTLDAEILSATASTGGFKGIIGYADGGGFTYTDSSSTNLLTVDKVRELRKLMGKYALKPSKCALVLNATKYYQLLDDDSIQTVDKFGDQATLLKGEVAKVEGIPVVLTENITLNSTDASGNYSALLFNMKSFGLKMKDILVEFDKEITDQTRTIVMSTRTSMVPLYPLTSGNLASANSICAVIENG